MKREIEIMKPTGVLTRSCEMIFVGDEVESVQGTIFKVVERENEFFLERPEGLYDLKPFMSPNLWKV